MAKRNSVGSMQRNLQSSKNFQPQYGTAQDDDGENGVCAALITFASYILVFLTLPISIWGCVKVTREAERTVSLSLKIEIRVKCEGCTRVRESRHIQTWETPVWGSKGTRIVLHPSLHRHLQVGLQHSV